MDSFSAIIVASVLAALCIEIVMLEIFRKKIIGIEFTNKESTAFFRFFTLARVSVFASLHTIFLCFIFIGIYFFL